MWYVYFLQNPNTKFLYIGSTNNLRRRLHEHSTAQHKSTKGHLPLEIIGFVALPSERQVRMLEKYFKTGSGKSVLKRHILVL